MATKILSIYVFIFTFLSAKSQLGNYVANGSFEEYYDCNGPFFPISKAKNWLAIDSSSFAALYFSTCNFKVPTNGNTYQIPRSGEAYVITNLYHNDPPGSRGYPKNRLKENLKTGVPYCVKFHINIANSSPRGIDGFGAYFGGAFIDTITQCNGQLTFINPQIKNPQGNVISDTLNWTAITGTFVADGTEKYLLLGNFLADSAVTSSPIYSSYFPQRWTDVLFDDVSCIEMNLPAYAGPDKVIVPGDSAFIGREPDFAIDPGCRWYVLPGMTPLDTISGIWVKPPVTTTYVVRQELDCSSEKWDTVVVHVDLVGVRGLSFEDRGSKLQVFPVPADEVVEIRFQGAESGKMVLVTVRDLTGRIVQEEPCVINDKTHRLDVSHLLPGIYLLRLASEDTPPLSGWFVIGR